MFLKSFAMKIAILLFAPCLFVATAFGQSVTVVSPNGFQRWEAGSQRKILFTSSNVIDVRIEYSPNNGITWSEAVASTPASSGSYLWTVGGNATDQGLIRIASVANPNIADTSDQWFSVVPPRSGGDLDFLFFSDSPTSVFYDPSFGFVTPPSTLERVGEKFPVSTQYSLVGNYSLKLNWNSQSGGDWGMAVAGIGWVPRDANSKDSLTFHVFSRAFMFSGELPLVYLEDVNNRKTGKIPLQNFLGAIGQELWQRCAIPLQAFRDNPGQADLTQIKTIFFGQDLPDSMQHVWYLDDIRMKSIRQYPDSVKLIVVLGSSSAAGVGPSHPDSAWVARYRAYIQAQSSSAAVVNLAVGGFTTYNAMPTGFIPPPGRPSPNSSNNISMALAHQPSAIVVNLPSNDVAFGYSVAEQLANYDTLNARSLSRNVPLWIGTSQPRNISDPARRDLLRVMTDSILARFGNRAINVWNGLANIDGTILSQYNSGDGIHLNSAGHRLIYERVVAAQIWQTITTIEREWQIPETFVLQQNYPNPFNAATTINYQLSSSSLVSLKVFDALGREVSNLVNEVQPTGSHTVMWDAMNVSSGVYFYRLATSSLTQTKKMVLTR